MAFPKDMIALGAGIAFSFALVAGSQAQEFPSGPITIVVPFSASGSAPNVLARNLADRLQAEWGQPVVVENRPAPPARSPRNMLLAMPRTGTP